MPKPKIDISEAAVHSLPLRSGAHVAKSLPGFMVLCGRQSRTYAVTVRQFLQQRFGIVTGAREYWHPEHWTPDRADLKDFLRALRDARVTARRAA